MQQRAISRDQLESERVETCVCTALAANHLRVTFHTAGNSRDRSSYVLFCLTVPEQEEILLEV